MIMWVLRDLPHACVYIDDVLIGTGAVEGKTMVNVHFEAVVDVLEAFRQAQVTAKGTKVHLFMTSIKFCGHILSDGQRRAAPSKLQAIANWQPAMVKTVTHLRGFLGLAQYYSTYVKDFAQLAAPLTEQLKGRTPTNKKITWNSDMLKSFEALKSALLENGTLATGPQLAYGAIFAVFPVALFVNNSRAIIDNYLSIIAPLLTINCQ